MGNTLQHKQLSFETVCETFLTTVLQSIMLNGGLVSRGTLTAHADQFVVLERDVDKKSIPIVPSSSSAGAD